jgi:hypothetical protein
MFSVIVSKKSKCLYKISAKNPKPLGTNQEITSNAVAASKLLRPLRQARILNCKNCRTGMVDYRGVCL